MITRSARFVAFRTIVVKICICMTNRIFTPRKSFSTHSSTCGFFPLCLSRQTVAIRRPIHFRCSRACFHDRTAYRVTGSESFFLTLSITPLDHIPPTNGLHGMIACFSSTCTQVCVTIADCPGPNHIPLCFCHLVFAHVKLAHGDIHRRSIAISISTGVSHGENSNRN